MVEVSGKELWQWRRDALQQLMDSDLAVQELTQELDWLLMAIAPLDRLALRLDTYRETPHLRLERSLSELSQLWQRRLQERVPIQYLLGRTSWRDFDLQVTPAVLIPRPETELLIDLALQCVAQPDAPMEWADLGTGSGAIAIGLARSFPKAMIHAVDCSAAALKVAQSNAQNLGVADQIQFYEGNWLAPLQELKGQLNGIVSNPPYIPTQAVQALAPEVTNHEPHLALDGGADGLDAVRILCDQAGHYLKPGGYLLMELMIGQAEAVQALLQINGPYEHISCHADLAGIERFVLARKCVAQP